MLGVTTPKTPPTGLARVLGLGDLIFIVLGTVIGSGIFIVPGTVLRQVDGRLGVSLGRVGRRRCAFPARRAHLWRARCHGARSRRHLRLHSRCVRATAGLSVRLDLLLRRGERIGRDAGRRVGCVSQAVRAHDADDGAPGAGPAHRRLHRDQRPRHEPERAGPGVDDHRQRSAGSWRSASGSS